MIASCTRKLKAFWVSHEKRTKCSGKESQEQRKLHSSAFSPDWDEKLQQNTSLGMNFSHKDFWRRPHVFPTTQFDPCSTLARVALTVLMSSVYCCLSRMHRYFHKVCIYLNEKKKKERTHQSFRRKLSFIVCLLFRLRLRGEETVYKKDKSMCWHVLLAFKSKFAAGKERKQIER